MTDPRIADHALGIERPLLIAHSMGAMIAAEMASVAPDRVPKLALLAPAGLWWDEHPVADIFATLPQEMPALLFHDPEAGAAALTGGVDFSDTEALIAFFAANAKPCTCMARSAASQHRRLDQ